VRLGGFNAWSECSDKLAIDRHHRRAARFEERCHASDETAVF